MTGPEFWSDGSPIIDYPQHDALEEPEVTMPEFEMPDLSPHPYAESILGPIDATSAWQTLILQWSEQDFTYKAMSRGPVPRIDEAELGDLADRVVVETDPEDTSYRTTHVLTYTGDLSGLEMLRDILTTTLDRGAEGNRDMIVEAGGPLLWLGLLGRH